MFRENIATIEKQCVVSFIEVRQEFEYIIRIKKLRNLKRFREQEQYEN